MFPESPCSLMLDDVFEAISPASEGNQEATRSDTFPKPAGQSRKKNKCNERERYRHRTVNDAFKVLGNFLPVYPVHKKLKKRDILIQSIKYINILQTILHNLDQTPHTQIPARRWSTDDLTQPDEEFDIETDSHPITLISDHLPSSSFCSEFDQTSTSTSGSTSSRSDDLGQLTVTQAGDGVDDWLADMVEAGYCNF